MSKVFVVNEPLKVSSEGTYGRAIDLRPAQKFGELVFLSAAGEPPLDPSAWLPRMYDLLSSFSADDYLLPVGHPSLIVAAGFIIGKHAQALAAINVQDIKELRVLIWCGKPVGYAPLSIPLFQSQSQGESNVKEKI